MSDRYDLDELRRVAAELHLSGYLARIVKTAVPDTRLQAIADALEVVDCRACFVHNGMGDAASDVCDNRYDSEDEDCFMYDMIRIELVQDALTEEDKT